ncbi:MAG: O-antigen ligase family protein [Chloroflexota bacterium]
MALPDLAAQTDPGAGGCHLGSFVLAGLGFTLIGVVSANWTVKVPFLAALLPQRLLSLPEGDSAGVQTNQLAGTILFYFPLLASLLIGVWGQRAWRNWRTWGVLAGTAVMGGLLLLTQSRSGWLGGLGGMLVLLALWGLAAAPGRQRFWLRLALLVALVALFAGLAVIGPTRLAALWQDPDLETAVGNLGTINFRKEVWHWGLLAVSDFPFTGTGLGSFRRVIHRFYPTTILPTYDIAHAHNIFLQVALDVGLPGLVAYGALLLLVGYMGWQVARYNERWRALTLGLLAGLAAVHIFGLTDALALGAKPGLLFWWALGLLTVLFTETVNGER